MPTTSPRLQLHRVLWDDAQKGHSETKLKPDAKIKRVVLCSGKVYYDLLAERDARGLDDVYLLRIEQYYPFPALSSSRSWSGSRAPRSSGARKSQEPGRVELRGAEPRMGAEPHRRQAPPRRLCRPRGLGLARHGLASRHKAEQTALVNDALTLGGKSGGPDGS